MDANTQNLLASGAGVLIGALITWVASRYYYVRSGRDLRSEAASLRAETSKLHALATNLCRALEEKGLAEFAKDADGTITGIVIHLSGTIAGHAEAHGELTVVPGTST